MKKSMQIFLLLFVMMTSLICVGSVKADDTNVAVEFNDFVYAMTYKYENGEKKVYCQIAFEASQPVAIKAIAYEIKSQQGDIVIYNKNVSKSQSYSFVIEDVQTGTLKLVIEYNVADNDGLPLVDKTYTKTVYLANGTWKEEMDWNKAIILGFFTMICVIAATSVIISSSKKEMLNKEMEEDWEEEL